MESMLPGSRSNRPIYGHDPRLPIRSDSSEIAGTPEDTSISLFSVASRGVANTADEAVTDARMRLERTVSVGNATREHNLRRLSKVADDIDAVKADEKCWDSQRQDV